MNKNINIKKKNVNIFMMMTTIFIVVIKRSALQSL